MNQGKVAIAFRKFGLWTLDLAINLAIIFGLVFVIQKWVIAPFDVSGASMCNTFNVIDGECVNDFGEKIIINEAVYIFGSPQRGEVVIFTTPEDEDKYYIKRVIGLPEETVKIQDGQVYVKGKGDKYYLKLEEKYLNDDNKENTQPILPELDTFEVPYGHYFLLGDNRNNSTDSRSCFQRVAKKSCPENPEQSFIPKELIRGKAWFVWFPIRNIRQIDIPEYRYIVDESIIDSEPAEETTSRTVPR